jgi:hypothetical protein
MEQLDSGLLYRLRHFPSSPHEHIVSMWLSLHQTPAVVSHESARGAREVEQMGALGVV